MAPVELVQMVEDVPECTYLIEGYPGIGMVGVIAVRHLIREKNAEPAFMLKVEDVPLAAVVHEGKPYPSAGVYVTNDLALFYAEFPEMRPKVVRSIPEEIADLAVEMGVEKVICIAGIRKPDLEGKPEVYYVATSEEAAEPFKDLAEPLEKGTITGVSGPLLLESDVRGLEAACLLVETPGMYPDPRAAARVLEILKEAIDVEVDISALEEEADKIAKSVQEAMERMKREQEIEESTEERMFV